MKHIKKVSPKNASSPKPSQASRGTGTACIPVRGTGVACIPVG